MKIKKSILVKGRLAVLCYDDDMFNKKPNALIGEHYEPAIIKFSDNTIALEIFGGTYFDESDTIDDYYFIVNDLSDEIGCEFTEAIYEPILDEVDLLKVFYENSRYIRDIGTGF